MAKVTQKFSGRFRSPECVAVWRRISSCLKPAGFKGCNPMTAMETALVGKAAKMA